MRGKKVHQLETRPHYIQALDKTLELFHNLLPSRCNVRLDGSSLGQHISASTFSSMTLDDPAGRTSSTHLVACHPRGGAPTYSPCRSNSMRQMSQPIFKRPSTPAADGSCVLFFFVSVSLFMCVCVCLHVSFCLCLCLSLAIADPHVWAEVCPHPNTGLVPSLAQPPLPPSVPPPPRDRRSQIAERAFANRRSLVSFLRSGICLIRTRRHGVSFLRYFRHKATLVPPLH